MNWGKGIMIVMGLFIVFIGVLVSVLAGQKVDLVSEEYYKEEIAYQHEIDAMHSAKLLDLLVISQQDGQLIVQFAKNIEADSIVLKLWRPNNQQLDQSFSVTGTHVFLIPLNTLQQGMYDIRCEYWTEGKNFLQKQSVLIK
ncbi:MAG: FixH family protein [Crocinitomicaceae bacterium]|nr:FixH family protein [Crocinitomicaceae bacterium]NGF75934.1 cytochrome C oxidase Cbb3 [Fluviicola sp. SGL-29]